MKKCISLLMIFTAIGLSSCAVKNDSVPELSPNLRASDTGVDVSALPTTLGTATSSDQLVAYDQSASQGSRIVGLAFNNSATQCLNGQASWIDCIGALLSDTSPQLGGDLDLNGNVLNDATGVDDDDCTGDQGKFWWDSTDNQWEACNANSGTPLVLGSGSGLADVIDDTTPQLGGNLDLNAKVLNDATGIDDDDCTGDQGKMWWDSTDNQWEACNANSGTPLVIGAGGGNVSDNTAEAITGVWEIQDNTNFAFGNDADWVFLYDETTDDALELTSSNATSNFDIKLGDAAGATSVRILDSGGTLQFEIDSDGGVTQSARANPQSYYNSTDVDVWTGSNDTGDVWEIRLSSTPGTDVIASFNIDGTDDFNVTGDVTVGGGDIKTGNIALTVGDATTDSITLQTDGTGIGELTLPTGSVAVEDVENDLKTHMLTWVFEDVQTTTATKEKTAILIPTAVTWLGAYSRCDATPGTDPVFTVYYNSDGSGTLTSNDTFTHDAAALIDSEDITDWSNDPAAFSYVAVDLTTAATTATACTFSITFTGN